MLPERLVAAEKKLSPNLLKKHKSLLYFLHQITPNSSHTSVLPHDLQETSQELRVPSEDLTKRLKAAEHRILETIETAKTCLCSKKNSGSSQTQVLRATQCESSLCLSSMKPRLEYFKPPRLKITPVTLHSNWQPSGGQRHGVRGGRNSNTLHHQPQQHQPPRPASSCVSDMSVTAG